jgi:hypothetical protein
MTATLDERARQAAAGLRATVAEADLRMATPGGTPRKPLLAGTGAAALAGAALAAVVLLVGVALVRPSVVASDGASTTTTAPPATASLPTTILPATSLPATTAPVPGPTVPAADTTPPLLEITFPTPGYVSEEPALRFAGRTEPGAVVTAGPYTAEVGPDGAWSIVLVLGEGETVARFVATDASGNRTEASVAVSYLPKPVTTTTAKAAGFVAHFTWGECSIDPPYDEYYGEGEPGSAVSVVSEYGSGSTTVGEDGRWALKVEFPSAPPNVTFPVKAKDSLGRSVVFEFTSRVGG